jgi:CSLREA domain-containing protein
MPRGGRAAGKLGWIASAIVLAALLAPASTPASTIKVKSSLDEFGAAGNCTLREAIQAANTDADFGGCVRKRGGIDDVVVLTGGTEYDLGIGGLDDANATGDLDVTTKMTLEVRGEGQAVIDANDVDRSMDVLETGNLRASRLLIGDGTPLADGFQDGGGAILNRGRLTLSDSELSGNDSVLPNAENGGALQARGPLTKLNRVLISQNDAGNIGGGIAHTRGRLRVTNSVISDNVSDSSGGGIEVSGSDDEGRLLLKRTTLSGNTSNADGGNFGGGGIGLSYFGEGTLKATNVTISGNTAFANGGGIFSYAGEMALNGTTVTSNTANFDGDADGNGGGAAGIGLTFHNSIIAGNEDASLTDPQQDCAISVNLFKGHNIVGLGGGCAEGNTNKPVVDPGLGPLGDNGGHTPTHKPLKTSDAIGHAGKDAPKKDQRGVKRDADPDAGAYER